MKKRKLFIKVIAVMLSTFLMVTMLPSGTFALDEVNAATTNGYVHVNALQDYAEVQDALTALNTKRKSDGLSTVKLDQELCNLAVQRAAESVVATSPHTRPNGDVGKTISSRVEKENYAMGTFLTGTNVINDIWWTSDGHKANMMYNKAVSIGIGFITVEGSVPYCMLLVSSTKVGTEMTTKSGTKLYDVKIEVKNDNLKEANLSLKKYCQDGDYVYFEDIEDMEINRGLRSCVLYRPNLESGREEPLASSSFKWTSSNKLVATVDQGGHIDTHYPGTATITAEMKSAPNLKVSVQITVEDSYFGYDQYDYKSDPYYPQYFAEDDDDDSWMFGYKAGTLDTNSSLSDSVNALKSDSSPLEISWYNQNNKKLVGPFYFTTYYIEDIDMNDVLTYRVSDSDAENEELLSHITLKTSKYGTQNGCTIDEKNHTISFTKYGMFYLTAEGDGQIDYETQEFCLTVTSALQSATLYIDPSNQAEVFSNVEIDTWISGGRNHVVYNYTITNKSGKVVAEYDADSYLYKEWNWVPDETGTYTIKVSVYDTTEPDIVKTDTATYKVIQAEHPLIMPEEAYTMTVNDKLGDIILPEGWAFDNSDINRTLNEDDSIDVTVYYKADNAHLFKNTTATIKVNCVACDHSQTEVRNASAATCVTKGYSGDTYCKKCNMQLARGNVLEIDEHNHESLITTEKPSEIFAPGHTEHQYCTTCNQVEKQGAEIPAIDSYEMTTTSLEYTGEAQTVKGVFKAGSTVLVEGTDYTTEYTDNKEIGKATVKYTFKGKYNGTFEDYFAIEKNGTWNTSATPLVNGVENGSDPETPSNPGEQPDEPTTPTTPAEIVNLPKVTIKTPKAGKKKVTVKWKKVSKTNQKKISGIEIQVASDSKFVTIVKKTTAGKTKTSKTIKSLKSKKTYWVRIRAYKKASDGKHVSVWKSKKFKVK